MISQVTFNVITPALANADSFADITFTNFGSINVGDQGDITRNLTAGDMSPPYQIQTNDYSYSYAARNDSVLWDHILIYQGSSLVHFTERTCRSKHRCSFDSPRSWYPPRRCNHRPRRQHRESSRCSPASPKALRPFG